MGADPIVVAVAVVSGSLHGFLVRKAEKQHGTGQRIEGFREKGARVVIVDDVCTTGASTVQAIEAAREFGFEIAGVMCLVEREEAEGRLKVEKAAASGAVRLHLQGKRGARRAPSPDRRHGTRSIAGDLRGSCNLRNLRPPRGDEYAEKSLRDA